MPPYLYHSEGSLFSRKNITKKDCFAVDFYLWGCQKICQPSHVTQYSKSQTPFEVVGVKGCGSNQAVFHLWRPAPHRADDSDNSDNSIPDIGDMDPLKRPEVQRELYRFHHAPHLWQQFDPKTGIQAVPPWVPTDHYVSPPRETSKTLER